MKNLCCVERIYGEEDKRKALVVGMTARASWLLKMIIVVYLNISCAN